MNEDKEVALRLFTEAADIIASQVPPPVMPNDVFYLLKEIHEYLGLTHRDDMSQEQWEWNRDLDSRIIELMLRL